MNGMDYSISRVLKTTSTLWRMLIIPHHSLMILFMLPTLRPLLQFLREVVMITTTSRTMSMKELSNPIHEKQNQIQDEMIVPLKKKSLYKKLLQNKSFVNLKLHLLDNDEFDVKEMREYSLDRLVLNEENKGLDPELKHEIADSQSIDP